MADRKVSVPTPIEGETRFGSTLAGLRGLGYIPSQGIAGRGSVFALDSIDNTGAVTTYYLFFGSDGKLRTASTEPTNTNTDGTVVGSQS